MELSDIPVKTAAGHEEIARRDRRLPTRLRTLLILADGKRSVQALADATVGFGPVDEPLAHLVTLGLIEPMRKAAPPDPSSAPALPASRAALPQGVPEKPAHERPAPRPGQRRSLALARLYLLNAMEQSLRQDDQPIRDCLRAAKTRAELLQAFEVCREVAQEVGVKHIRTIEAQFFEMLPEEG